MQTLIKLTCDSLSESYMVPPIALSRAHAHNNTGVAPVIAATIYVSPAHKVY